MRRVAVIVGTCALVVTAAAVVADRTWGDAAAQAGADVYAHRAALTALHALAAGGTHPDVVFLGDLTLLRGPRMLSYPELIARTWLVPAGRSAEVLAANGLDFYAFYGLVGLGLEADARVVVLLANLRLLGSECEYGCFTDLWVYVPAAELPRTLTLPYQVRGASAGRLLLARALWWRAVERAWLAAAGLHAMFQQAQAWDVAGPVEKPGALRAARLMGRFRARQLREFDRPVWAGHPLVALAGATVRLATAGGARVLVVVPPIPYERLRADGIYDPERTSARIELLRRAVETAGGHFLDLHRALGADGFRDHLDHYSAAGMQRMAGFVWEALRPLLEEHGTPPATLR